LRTDAGSRRSRRLFSLPLAVDSETQDPLVKWSLK